MKKFFILIVLCAGIMHASYTQDYAVAATEYCDCYKKLSDTISAEFQQLIIRVAKSTEPKTAFAKEIEKLDAPSKKELSEQLVMLGTIMDSDNTEAGRCGLALDKKYKKYNDTPAREKEFNKKMSEQLKNKDCEFLWAVSVFALAFSDAED
jgi:hypothetical protein